MRRNTVVSLTLSVLLAVLAVFATRAWLNSERIQIMSDSQKVVEKVIENQIVVASTSLRFGERIDKDKLKLIDWPIEMMPAGTFTEIDEVVGTGDEGARYVLFSIQADEPILASRLTIPGQRAKLSTALTPGMKAISIRVNDVLGVAGFVLPGDRVDVMLLRGGSRNAGSSYVDVLLQGVKVLAIDQTVDDRKDKPSVVRTVTFEVSTIEAQKLLLGASVGRLSLALRNLSSSDVQDINRITLSDLSDGDVTESLAKAMADEAKIEEEAKIVGLEGMVKDVSDTLNDRLNSVEQLILDQKADEKETEISAEESALIAEKEAILATIEENNKAILEKIAKIEENKAEVKKAEAKVVKRPRRSKYLTVGVTRSGRRSEYKVKELEPGELELE